MTTRENERAGSVWASAAFVLLDHAAHLQEGEDAEKVADEMHEDAKTMMRYAQDFKAKDRRAGIEALRPAHIHEDQSTVDEQIEEAEDGE